MWLAQYSNDIIYNTTIAEPTTTSTNSGLVGGILIAFLLLLLGLIIAAILYIVGSWKMYKKAGQPGWSVLIPNLNVYFLLKIAKKPVWWVIVYFYAAYGVGFFSGFFGGLLGSRLVTYVLMLIGFVYLLVYWFIIQIGVGKNFGKSSAFSVLWLGIFFFIGPLILGFNNDRYLGESDTDSPVGTLIPPQQIASMNMSPNFAPAGTPQYVNQVGSVTPVNQAPPQPPMGIITPPQDASAANPDQNIQPPVQQ
jgi:hypothetical protein